jgi:hypothetical protein
MFVPVCDRPSVAKLMGAQGRDVMETRSAAIHRKMPASTRQLPITGSAHKAGIVGDDGVRAVLTTLDMPAERCRAAALEGRYHLELAKADTAGVGRSRASSGVTTPSWRRGSPFMRRCRAAPSVAAGSRDASAITSSCACISAGATCCGFCTIRVCPHQQLGRSRRRHDEATAENLRQLPCGTMH